MVSISSLSQLLELCEGLLPQYDISWIESRSFVLCQSTVGMNAKYYNTGLAPLCLELVPLLVLHLLHQLMRSVCPVLVREIKTKTCHQPQTLDSAASLSVLSSTSFNLFPLSPAARKAFAISLSPLMLLALKKNSQ